MREPTAEELEALDKLVRVLEPEAWAEYDEGGGVCSNGAGFTCLASIEAGKRLIKTYPGVIEALKGPPKKE